MGASLRFWFELRPVEDVVVELRASGNDLSWFWLTDGAYDVELDGVGMFSGRERRGVEYAVVRLWEDVLQIMPHTLVPLPSPVAERVLDIERWQRWADRAFEECEDLDLVASALQWWWDRYFDTNHLIEAPTPYMWRIGDSVHIRWRGADPGAFTHPDGDFLIEAERFRDSVAAFDAALLAAMQQRIDGIADAAAAAQLRAEHAERSRALARAPYCSVQPVWDDVVSALVELEQRIPR